MLTLMIAIPHSSWIICVVTCVAQDHGSRTFYGRWQHPVTRLLLEYIAIATTTKILEKDRLTCVCILGS
jgi:hypothetical protein